MDYKGNIFNVDYHLYYDNIYTMIKTIFQIVLTKQIYSKKVTGLVVNQ